MRAVLALGVAASVTANVLHAHPNPISQTIAGWPPIALLLAVELISRIPIHRRGLAAVRIVATALIAGIAAWVSYWHMAAVAARYGETGAAAYLLPLSVDGLIMVASVCLVELGGRLSATATARTATLRDVSDRATAVADPDAPVSAQAVPPTAARSSSPSACAEATRARMPGTAAPPGAPPAPYTPTSDDDAAMYAAWRHGVANGQEPSGAQLARVAGRADDATGVGRRAARRYRKSHASQPTELRGHASHIQPRRSAPAAQSAPTGHSQPGDHTGEQTRQRHNGHHLTSAGAAR